MSVTATSVRKGGRYEIDPETGEERLVEEPTAPAPAPAAAPDAPKKKVK